MSDKREGLPPAMAEIRKQDDVIKDLRHQLQQAEARVAELFDLVSDFQQLSCNALDADYVDKHVKFAMTALLHKSAKITEEADPSDIEPLPFVLRKQAEAVDASKSLFSRWSGSIITVEHGRVILEQEARRLHHRADELEAEDAGDSND